MLVERVVVRVMVRRPGWQDSDDRGFQAGREDTDELFSQTVCGLSVMLGGEPCLLFCTVIIYEL